MIPADLLDQLREKDRGSRNPGGSMSQQDVLDCVCRSKRTWEATDERIDGLLAIIGRKSRMSSKRRSGNE